MSRDAIIKIIGAGKDVAHGNVVVDGRKVAEVTFTPAPSNPFDRNSESIPCNLFETLLGEYWVVGGERANEFVRRIEVEKAETGRIV